MGGPPREASWSVEPLDDSTGFGGQRAFGLRTEPWAGPREREADGTALRRSSDPGPATGSGRLRWGSGHRLVDAISDFRTLRGRGDSFQEGCFRRWAERWGCRRLGTVSSQDLDDYLGELSRDERARGEIDLEKVLLRSFYQWALRCGIVRVDPTSALSGERQGSARRRLAWTAAEERRLLDACRGDPRTRCADPGDPPPRYLYPLLLLAVRTGLQLKELLDLQWCHVDLLRGRVRVPAPDGRYARSREVLLDGECVRALETLLARATRSHSAPRRVLESAGLPLTGGRPDEQTVLDAIFDIQKNARVSLEDFASSQGR